MRIYKKNYLPSYFILNSYYLYLSTHCIYLSLVTVHFKYLPLLNIYFTYLPPSSIHSDILSQIKLCKFSHCPFNKEFHSSSCFFLIFFSKKNYFLKRIIFKKWKKFVLKKCLISKEIISKGVYRFK